MPRYTPAVLTSQEQWIFDETRRTGNLNIFTNYFFRLPKSGSRWMPGDAIGHYRHVFDYEQLYDAWSAAGRPDDAFDLKAGDQPFHITVDWNANQAEFLLLHGYLFFDWVKPVIDLRTDIALVITGTGTSKTSSVAIAALTCCALYPGFGFMNIAPSEKQSSLIVEELKKWAGGSPFRKFLKPTTRGELYIKKPYVLAHIISPLNYNYPSTFACQTIGINAADAILGGSEDWYNIDEAGLVPELHDIIPKVVTRSRAARADGTPRLTKFTMLSNPHPDNVSIDMARNRIEEIQRNPTLYGPEVRALYMDGIGSDVNLYTTQKQHAYQKSMMDASAQARWRGGVTEEFEYTNTLPKRLIIDNIDPVMDDEIRVKGLHQSAGRDGLGLIHYELPREEDHIYMVVGDPGKNNAASITYNNVPVVLVLDVTHFLKEPAKLVYFSMLDGQGTYHAWLGAFKYAMLKYRAHGYYDATNQPGFEAAGAFNSSLDFTYFGQTYKAPSTFITYEVTFANLNKRFARTLFILLAQDGQFAWPRLEALIHQARIYREDGTDVKKLADDIIAALFVYCLALRMDGSLWDKVVQRYYWLEADEAKQAELAQDRALYIDRAAARGEIYRPERSRQ